MKTSPSRILSLCLCFLLAACQLPLPVVEGGAVTPTSSLQWDDSGPGISGTPRPTPTPEAPPEPEPEAASFSAYVSPVLAGWRSSQPEQRVEPDVQAGTPAPDLSAYGTLQPLPSANLDVPRFYILQKGEFPYCIARRYNVDPVELMRLNRLAHGQTLRPGVVLHLPQSGKPFPGERALRRHPVEYTVHKKGETVRSVACLFGDLDPAMIAGFNQLDVNASLRVGQVLQLAWLKAVEKSLPVLSE